MSSSGNMQNAAFAPMRVGLPAPPPEFDSAVVLANVGSDRLDGLAGNGERPAHKPRWRHRMRISPGNPDDAARLQRLKTFSAHVTLATAFVLSAVKLGGWLLTGSMALMASAVNSLVDAGASFVTLLGVRYAQKPPDRDHRFGHGKGEAVAAFTQATFLAGAAFVLAFQSIQRLLFPVPLEALQVGVILIAGSLVVACGLVAMQSYVVARTGSTAIAADRAHYQTDIALNAAVLVALGVTEVTGWTRADPAIALVISGYMLWNAYGIAREALEQLLDRELPSEERRNTSWRCAPAPACATSTTCAPGSPATGFSSSTTSRSIPG